MEFISLIWTNGILNPMINSLLWIYNILANNFGLAIIVFTVVVRLITYPLTASQMKSAQKMQDLQKSKEWQDIQAKYKNEKEKLSQEQMKLYREMGVNPFGSCLPTLIQFPIIIGLYQAITRALAVTPIQLLELTRHVYPFTNAATLIPLNNYFLWMDLSLPESAFGIPFPGTSFFIPVLTILVVVTSYLQTKVMTPATANPNDQGASMSRSMNITMPLFMGWISYSFPSGLALYFLTSNVAAVAQYAIQGKVDWRTLIPGRKTDAPTTTTKKTQKTVSPSTTTKKTPTKRAK